MNYQCECNDPECKLELSAETYERELYVAGRNFSAIRVINVNCPHADEYDTIEKKDDCVIAKFPW